MHCRTIFAACAVAFLALPLPVAAQGEPSAAPTSEIEGRALPPIGHAAPAAHAPSAEAHQGAPAEAVVPDERTGTIMAGAIFAIALLFGLIAWWLVSRRGA